MSDNSIKIKCISTIFLTVKLNAQLESEMCHISDLNCEHCKVTKKRLNGETLEIMFKGDYFKINKIAQVFKLHLQNLMAISGMVNLMSDILPILDDFVSMHGTEFEIKTPYMLLDLLVSTFNHIHSYLGGTSYTKGMFWPLEQLNSGTPQIKTKMIANLETADKILSLIERFLQSSHIPKFKDNRIFRNDLNSYEKELRDIWDRVLDNNHDNVDYAVRLCKLFLNSGTVNPNEIFESHIKNLKKTYYYTCLDYARFPEIAKLLLDAGADPQSSHSFLIRLKKNRDSAQWSSLIVPNKP